MLAPLSSHDELARPRFARRLVITRYFVLMLREKPLQCIPRCAAAASQSPRRPSAIEDLPVQGVRKLVALGNGPVPGSRSSSSNSELAYRGMHIGSHGALRGVATLKRF